jgi:uncharacterized damage-inducible protein DinB
MTTWVEEFTGNCLFRLEESERMIGICLDGLAESDFWHRPNSAANSIGNLLLHLSGNLTQYVVSGLGGTPDHRDRDAEFSTKAKGTKETVWKNFKEVLNNSKSVISEATAEQLLKYRNVQGFNLSGLGMALHAVEHLSYHTGQIALLVKSMKGEDLGFYRGADLNQHND